MDFYFLSDTYDVTETEQELEFHITITTDLLENICFSMRSPSEIDWIQGCVEDADLIGQSNNETTYYGSTIIPQFIEPGIYTMGGIDIWAGDNYIYYNHDEDEELNDYQVLIINNSGYDNTAPNLIDFSIDPNTVDVSNSEQIINYQIHAADDWSGLVFVRISLCGINDCHYSNNSFDSTLDTLLIGEVIIPTLILPGIYDITIRLGDYSDNYINYRSEDLNEMGLPYEVLVQNNSGFDATPPQYLGFNYSVEDWTFLIEEAYEGIDSQIQATVTENSSNQIWGNISYNNSGACDWDEGSCEIILYLDAYNFPPGTIQTYPMYAANWNFLNLQPGVYGLAWGEIYDGNNNFRWYEPDLLIDLGLPPSITIIPTIPEEIICLEDEIAIFDQCFHIWGTYTISFSNQGLSGEIPPEIWENFSYLDHLYLDNNEFSSEIPPGLGSFSYLYTLYLNNNQFSGEIPPEIGNLDNLRSLNLSYNQLEGSLPDNFNNLDELELLLLNDNNLSGYVYEEICDIISRGFIDLSNNNFCPPYPECLTEEMLGNQDTSECPVEGEGCTDPEACNYDISATENDGSCDYVDYDGDGICDNDDNDDDNDGALDENDYDDNNENICSDNDGDTCDDCSGGSYDPMNDGWDYDGDGACDNGDHDDDNDGSLDDADSADNDPYVCSDHDYDTCDDCSQNTSDVSDPNGGGYAVSNDGWDYDGDGLCDAGDPDADNDGALDVNDSNDNDSYVCSDDDGDTCDDCSDGSYGLATDGPDVDADGVCDITDKCIGGNDYLDSDDDGMPDACDVNIYLDGLDLVSFFALPVETSIDTLFDSIEMFTPCIIDEGLSACYINDMWVGSIMNIQQEDGYWINIYNATSGAFLEIHGQPTEGPGVEETVYELHSGSNLISYPFYNCSPIEDTIPEDAQECIIGIMGEGVASWNDSEIGWIGGLMELCGGNGYWFIAIEDCDFTYIPPDTSENNLARQTKVRGILPEAFAFEQSTQQAFYFVENATIDGELLDTKDIIIAYNGGVMVGARYWYGEVTDVPAMGADDGEAYAGYCTSGDIISFKVWDHSQQRLIDMDTKYKVIWNNLDLQIINMTSKIIPVSYSLDNAYPNPFNPVTQIQYALPEDIHIELIIYDVLGRQVAELVNTYQQAGYHSAQWDANNHSSGIYFVKMIAGEYVSNQKLMLVK